MNGEEQEKKRKEYLDKVRTIRDTKPLMTTEEFYDQMEQSMGIPIKFIKKEEL